MTRRIGVVGIVVESKESVPQLNAIISDYAQNIIGRMGVPYHYYKELSVISLIVEGTTDEIGALTGKLGNLKGITVKTALTKVSM
ncbi:MAG: TM1266 family iron-only hydrogenase system putative regulator [Peptococcia bacterium]